MADWPDLDQLKRALGMDTAMDDHPRDPDLTLALEAAIEQVQIDVAGSTEAFTDAEIEPGPSLVQAALLLAVTVMKAPDAPFGVAAVFDTGGLYVASSNPNYRRLLKGQRQSFGMA